MKYAIIIPDGAADEPLTELGGKTPLEAADTPNMDAIARTGLLLKCTSEQLLVLERPVRFGRVEEGDAELDGAMDGGD